MTEPEPFEIASQRVWIWASPVIVDDLRKGWSRSVQASIREQRNPDGSWEMILRTSEPDLTNLSPTDGLGAWYEERFHVARVNFPIDPNLRAAYAAGRQSAPQEIEPKAGKWTKGDDQRMAVELAVQRERDRLAPQLVAKDAEIERLKELLEAARSDAADWQELYEEDDAPHSQLAAKDAEIERLNQVIELHNSSAHCIKREAQLVRYKAVVEALEQIADLAEQGEHTSGAAPIARAALAELEAKL